MNPSRAAVLQSLLHASQGLLFISESDAPFTPVDAPDVPFAALEDGAVRRLAGRPADDAVGQRGVDDFFRNAVKAQPWHSPEQSEDARRYRALVARLHESLPDARVYRVGEVSIDVLILGTGPGGGVLGLATRVVET